MKWSKAKITELLDILKKAYPEAECALDHGSVYQLLVAVTLSAQTTDVSVNKVSGTLFEKYPDPRALAGADPEDVADIIKKIGMYKTKSKRIVDQAKMLVDRFDGKVPEDDELLQQLPGVGRKTANVVMAVGFGHQRIAVDTHVFRVANRIGLVSEKDVLKTELGLQKVLPENRWTEAHHSFIFHGRRCCTARKPDCENCPIEKLCRKEGV
ncbi:MAG: endonuclease III [Eubacteriaceae bacterium]|nr:endonuclease III [Eubacteriaceae bacterium]